MKTNFHRPLPTMAATLALSLGQATANSADSPNVTVDTRTLTMTTLIVTGPSSIPWGQEEPFTATLNYQGAAPEDVTSQCEWSVTGGPPVTFWLDTVSMEGNVLHPKVASTVPLLVSAKITRNNGKIASNTVAVIVPEGNGMNVGIGLVWPTRLGPAWVRSAGGATGVWRVAAKADGLAAMKTEVTLQWYIGNQLLATGRSIDAEITGPSGTRMLKVVASAPGGLTGQDLLPLVFSSPPAPAEPPPLVKALDPGLGAFLDVDGKEFFFDPQKKAGELIVLTHGLNGTGKERWLQPLAEAIRTRLTNLGKRTPNIATYDWGSVANPSKYWGYDDNSQKITAYISNLLGKGEFLS